MADITDLTQFLTDVADSIRDKRGTEDKIKASDFDNTIKLILNDQDRLKIKNVNYLFAYGTRMEYYDYLISCFDGVESLYYTFYHMTYIPDLTKIDMSAIKKLEYTFATCTFSEDWAIEDWDTSNVVSMDYMFYQSTIPKVNLNHCDTSNVENMGSMFSQTYIKEIDMSQCDTSKVTNMANLCYNGRLLETLSTIRCDSVSKCGSIVQYCRNLVNVGGFINLGKGFTQLSNNYYHLDLSSCTKLTHESLMNIFNGLYDLNLTYDVANGGTLYTQKLSLGAENIAKMTEEELAIPVAKGWTIY